MAETTKRELKMLERIFAAEIDHALRESTVPFCFQSNSKLISAMAEKQLVEEVKYTLGGRFPMTITGWQLTERGRITYCATC